MKETLKCLQYIVPHFGREKDCRAAEKGYMGFYGYDIGKSLGYKPEFLYFKIFKPLKNNISKIKIIDLLKYLIFKI